MKSEQRAILTQQVRRVKPSLAGMSYRLEPGEVVYITQWLGRSVRASEVSDPSKRISEDYFDLEFGEFTLESASETASCFQLLAEEQAEDYLEYLLRCKGSAPSTIKP